MQMSTFISKLFYQLCATQWADDCIRWTRLQILHSSLFFGTATDTAICKYYIIYSLINLPYVFILGHYKILHRTLVSQDEENMHQLSRSANGTLSIVLASCDYRVLAVASLLSRWLWRRKRFFLLWKQGGGLCGSARVPPEARMHCLHIL